MTGGKLDWMKRYERYGMKIRSGCCTCWFRRLRTGSRSLRFVSTLRREWVMRRNTGWWVSGGMISAFIWRWLWRVRENWIGSWGILFLRRRCICFIGHGRRECRFLRLLIIYRYSILQDMGIMMRLSGVIFCIRHDWWRRMEIFVRGKRRILWRLVNLMLRDGFCRTDIIFIAGIRRWLFSFLTRWEGLAGDFVLLASGCMISKANDWISSLSLYARRSHGIVSCAGWWLILKRIHSCGIFWLQGAMRWWVRIRRFRIFWMRCIGWRYASRRQISNARKERNMRNYNGYGWGHGC